MEKKSLRNLEIKDVAGIELINSTEQPLEHKLNVTEERLTNLKNDAAETADCLASINSRIQDHLDKMERLKKLNINSI